MALCPSAFSLLSSFFPLERCPAEGLVFEKNVNGKRKRHVGLGRQRRERKKEKQKFEDWKRKDSQEKREQ